MDRTGASHAYDVIVAGGGPAGAAAAIFLTRAGARVALVNRAGTTGRLEGAAPRLVAVLKAHDLPLTGIGAATPRRARWGAITGAPNREHPVERPAFDAALVQRAEEEGVTVVRAGIARVEAGRAILADGRTLQAGLVVEARGRRAPVAAGRLRGPAALAIGGWTARGAGAEIRAGEGGWRWTLEGEEGAFTQVTLDAATPRSAFPEAWAALTLAPFPERPLVRAAEIRLAAPALDPLRPRIGDAAVAMDPLSGHGLFFALASALHAVPLVRALLDGEEGLAAAFYRARVVETFYRQARISRDFHRVAGFAGPYWAARAAWPDDEPAEAPPPATSHLIRQVVVREGRLAEADVLVTPREPGGVAFVRGLAVGAIFARAGTGPLPDRKAFATRVLADVPPEEAGLIHDWFIDRGVTTANLPFKNEVTI